MKIIKKYFTAIFLVLVLFTVLSVIYLYTSPNSLKGEIYIKSSDNSDSLVAQLKKNNCIKSEFTFKLALKILKLKKTYGGMYKIDEGLSNYELIKIFKTGRQSDISFRFGSNIFSNELFGMLGNKFEADSVEFANAILNSNKLEALGLDSQSCLALFWADTYFFPWSSKPEKLVDFFVNDQQLFWNTERMQKLAESGFKNTKDVYILASIVEKEAVKKVEMPAIAGVYINRLKKGMLLQADPTVKYANGIRNMSRVRGILDTNSLYNTYIFKGLPPGPIGTCTKAAIDSVLNFKKHNFLYFCAKDDFSNYHNFAETFAQHRLYAARYREALNKKGIK
ncbi:MAG: endolytic transglycosylase MltG [Bacteroidetes bacterium]|nr:endolytic transglycosylase MltG [Bacteroidota bacterium]